MVEISLHKRDHNHPEEAYETDDRHTQRCI